MRAEKFSKFCKKNCFSRSIFSAASAFYEKAKETLVRHRCNEIRKRIRYFFSLAFIAAHFIIVIIEMLMEKSKECASMLQGAEGRRDREMVIMYIEVERGRRWYMSYMEDLNRKFEEKYKGLTFLLSDGFAWENSAKKKKLKNVRAEILRWKNVRGKKKLTFRNWSSLRLKNVVSGNAFFLASRRIEKIIVALFASIFVDLGLTFWQFCKVIKFLLNKARTLKWKFIGYSGLLTHIRSIMQELLKFYLSDSKVILKILIRLVWFIFLL